MESPHDIRIESLNDERIEYYKKLSFINNEHDLHCVFNVLGRDLIIDKLMVDAIGFYLEDRVLNLDELESIVSSNQEVAHHCMFHSGDAKKYLREEAEKQINQLIADYEVLA